MKILTPEEVLQAIKDGKKLEWTYEDATEWYEFKPNEFTVENLLHRYYSFRLAQEIITIGDVSFPKPESEPLEEGTKYWVAEPSCQYYTETGSDRWEDDILDKLYLRRGLIHLTKENAIAHAKALIKLSGGSYE